MEGARSNGRYHCMFFEHIFFVQLFALDKIDHSLGGGGEAEEGLPAEETTAAEEDSLLILSIRLARFLFTSAAGGRGASGGEEPRAEVEVDPAEGDGATAVAAAGQAEATSERWNSTEDASLQSSL